MRRLNVQQARRRLAYLKAITRSPFAEEDSISESKGAGVDDALHELVAGAESSSRISRPEARA